MLNWQEELALVKPLNLTMPPWQRPSTATSFYLLTEGRAPSEPTTRDAVWTQIPIPPTGLLATWDTLAISPLSPFLEEGSVGYLSVEKSIYGNSKRQAEFGPSGKSYSVAFQAFRICAGESFRPQFSAYMPRFAMGIQTV